MSNVKLVTGVVLLAATVGTAQVAHGSTPEVIVGKNGEAEVIFSENNCVAYYDSNGRFTRANENCRRQQKQEAHAAYSRYRSEQGMSSHSREESGDPEEGFAEWQSKQEAANGPPQIFVGRNGEGEVTFSNNNCVVYFNSRGQRTRANNNCSHGQERHADNAMARHRREQGMTSHSSEEQGDPEEGFAEWQAQQETANAPPQIFVGRNGEGEVTFSSNNCVVYYNSRGQRTQRNDNCSRGQARQADDAMARHRREQGL